MSAPLPAIDALAAGAPSAERARAIHAFHLAMRTRASGVPSPAAIGAWVQGAGFSRLTPVEFDEQYQESGALGALVARKL